MKTNTNKKPWPIKKTFTCPNCSHTFNVSRVTLESKFWARINKTKSCWNWKGNKKSDGYGNIYHKGVFILAHRLSYEIHNGKIPKGLVIDHLCRNTRCVNPDHLEAVTTRENILRGEGVAAQNARKTHCKRGHEFTPDNIRKIKNGKACKTCYHATHQIWLLKKKGLEYA